MQNLGEDQSSSFGGEQVNQNSVACSHRGSTYLSNISGYTGPIFTIFSPYESALGLHADDGTVLYFAICQGTLPWQQIKVEKSANLLCGTAILKQIAISQF